MRMEKRGSRGFSLVEVVIAMAVIVIVSVAVISLILSSVRASQNAWERHLAGTSAEDILACYRVSGNEAEFKEELAFALGVVDIDLSALPLAGGYIARITYTDTALDVVVQDARGRVVDALGYTYDRAPSEGGGGT